MNNIVKEPWRELAEQAQVEQDRNKFLELMKEINRMLKENETRLAELRREEA